LGPAVTCNEEPVEFERWLRRWILGHQYSEYRRRCRVVLYFYCWLHEFGASKNTAEQIHVHRTTRSRVAVIALNINFQRKTHCAGTPGTDRPHNYVPSHADHEVTPSVDIRDCSEFKLEKPSVQAAPTALQQVLLIYSIRFRSVLSPHCRI